MRSLGLNLPVFLWAISWNVNELTSDPTVAAERAALMVSKELPGILSHWRRPPQTHNAGIRTQAAYSTMNAFALDTISELVGKEMGALAKVLVSPLDDLSEESLLEIHWKELALEVNSVAPTTWTIFSRACVLMMIAMAAFSRSHHMCKIQTLMTIYFKSCGIATKALDTLHTLGITMSQKWPYDGIEALSKRAHLDMVQDIARYPWFGIHDNVNIPFRVYQQRLDNQSHFDSGTAGTIISNTVS
ncbi:hypothetical protein BC827DRAFT_1158994 [Russula dissimulans]|nr:hypothetical protein BC827DRAFT_1158994 [Russula dissimulans]